MVTILPILVIKEWEELLRILLIPVLGDSVSLSGESLKRGERDYTGLVQEKSSCPYTESATLISSLGTIPSAK